MADLEHEPPHSALPSPVVDPYVVGIGASAGGLEALQHFFDNIAPDTAMAFVVVQHLSPDFKSLMDELLSRHTELPIHLVENGVQVEAGHVYLIPPKKEMIISEGRLLLSERDRQQELTLPIDVFFRSLAQDCGGRAVAIVLSGSGSDGSRGICDVHDAGGLVIIQDVDSAQFDGMPRTALDTGVADWILIPQHMPRVLESHVKSGGKSRALVVPASRSPSSAAFEDVYRMLEAEFGLDFTHYKPSTVTRRIERRLRLAQADDIQQYVERLRSERSELDILYRDLLIGVTRFFRNEEAFEILEHSILPDLLRAGSKDKPLRVWVAGCATGEEAYSLAILLHELTSRLGERSFKIFATDVHRGSLEVAGRAFYSEESLANVSQDRRDRYFIRVGTSYQLVPELRQSIVFAPHNVIKDAPFTRVDLVSCRNMLIYLQPTVQQKVLNQFHFSLNRGGIMFLGPSESPGALLKDFETVNRHWRIYKKHSDVRNPVDPRLQPRLAEPRFSSTQPAGAYSRSSPASLLATYDALLGEFMPPGLLVSERGELVHSFGGANRFLRRRDGRQGLDLAEQVDEELKLILSGGLRRALMGPAPISFKNVPLRTESEERTYNVSLRRVASRATEAPHLLISFEEVDPVQPPPNETAIDISLISRNQVGELQSELDYTKANLQSAIEQLETGNEELQASNEELMSSNEELQSTNEELQSVNEELYTVNAEYQSKITELTELTNDMDNLLASTEIGTIFLDEQLRIRKFTPQIAESFNLLPHDVGRSIENFTTTMDHPELTSDVRRVLASGERIEREIRDHRGRAYFLRILPYRAKGGTSGAVITFVDVGGLKAAEDALFHERYLLNSLLSSVPDAIYFRDVRGKFIRANPAAAGRLGLEDPAHAVGKTPSDVPEHETATALHRADEEVLRTGKPQYYKLEQRIRRNGTPEWDLVTRLPLTNQSRDVVGVIGVVRDVTTEKLAEAKIQEAVRRRDEFLAMLSHELRNPLAAVVTATELLKEKEIAPTDALGTLAVLDRQSQQMARLLDDLLDASRVTQNKIELRKETIDLRTVIEEATSASASTMESRELAFSVSITEEPLVVNGDASRLQQVCMNLLTNAAKYTPAGGHVSITASKEGGYAKVCVRDDGVGIAPEMLEPIFELFVQSNRTLERAQGGIGVGLTLARSLVEMHDGSITVHSDGVGKGSTFEMRLPLTNAPIQERRPSRIAARSNRGARIVVVEDNVDAREMMCHLLTRAGFECRAVGDGVAALDVIRSFRPHAAIIDVGLPGIDGFEVARRVRKMLGDQGVRLIAVTGYGQRADRESALSAGFDAHLVKPVKFDQLAQVLAKLDPDMADDGSGN